MCNLYRLHKSADSSRRPFSDMATQLGFPEGVPNSEPPDVHKTDRARIVRAAATRLAAWPPLAAASAR